MEGGFFTGQLLIAMPGIGDPRFERALILICAHDYDHAMGLTVNHPVEGLTVTDLLGRLGVTSDILAPPGPVLLGGPVERERGFVVHTDDYQGPSSFDIGGGMALSANRDVLEVIAHEAQRPRRSLLALGYAGWGEGQLEAEIKENVWLTCEADEDLIFGADHIVKWGQALGKIGVDPKRLSAIAGHA